MNFRTLIRFFCVIIRLVAQKLAKIQILFVICNGFGNLTQYTQYYCIVHLVFERKLNEKMQSDLLLEMGTASYVPVQLTSDSSRGWFIYYYIFNLIVGALEAKYVKLNRVKKQFRTISDEKVSTMC